ncbi:MAG: ArnT family glycosyltransferase [Phycisphaerales bacterium]
MSPSNVALNAEGQALSQIRNPKSEIRNHFAALALITLVVILIGFFDGGRRDLLNSLETGFALTSHEFARDGHWLVPTQGGSPRTVKPPLPFWIAAAAERLTAPLGVDPLGAMRAASVGMGAITAVFIYLLGCQMFDRRAGLLAAMVWATCMQSAMELRYARHDIYLVAFCAVAMLGVWRAWRRQRFGWTLTAVGLILAFQAKGPISWALVVLPAIIGAFIHWPVRWRFIASLIALMLLAGVLLLPWLVAFQYAIGEDKWYAFWWEGFARFHSDDAPKDIEPWFYVQYFAAMMPWSIYFIATLITPFEKRFGSGEQREPMKFLWLNVVVGLIFLTLPRDKAERYEVPLMASSALLIGHLMSYHWQLGREKRHDPKAKPLWRGHGILLVIAALAMPLFFLQQHWTSPVVALVMMCVLLIPAILTTIAFDMRRVRLATVGAIIFAGFFITAFNLAQDLWPGYHEPLKNKAAEVNALVGETPLFSYPTRADIALAYYLDRLAPVIRDSPFTRTYLPWYVPPPGDVSSFPPPGGGEKAPDFIRWLRSLDAPVAYAIVPGESVADFQAQLEHAGFTVTQALDLTTPRPRSDKHEMRDPVYLLRVTRAQPQ